MSPLQSENTPVSVCSPRMIFVWLCAVIAGLVCVGAGVEWLDYRYDSPILTMLDRMFDLDRESNVPTWVASSLLLVAGFELFAVSRTSLPHVERFRGRWVLLGVLFLLLSLDESARLHERLGVVIAGSATEDTNPLLRNRWVIVYGLGLVPIAAVYIRFVLALPGRMGRLMVLAGVVYVGGALGLEFFESLVQGDGERTASAAMFVLTTAQEALEMLGVAILIFATRDFKFGKNAAQSVELVNRDDAGCAKDEANQVA